MKDPSPHRRKKARINPGIDQGRPGACGQDLHPRLTAMNLELFDAEKKFLPEYR